MKFQGCCIPRSAPSPSGIAWFHSRFCEVGHGAQIDHDDEDKASQWVRNYESRKRAERLARQSEHPVSKGPHFTAESEEYEDYWSDRAYEQGSGK